MLSRGLTWTDNKSAFIRFNCGPAANMFTSKKAAVYPSCCCCCCCLNSLCYKLPLQVWGPLSRANLVSGCPVGGHGNAVSLICSPESCSSAAAVHAASFCPRARCCVRFLVADLPLRQRPQTFGSAVSIAAALVLLVNVLLLLPGPLINQ